MNSTTEGVLNFTANVSMWQQALLAMDTDEQVYASGTEFVSKALSIPSITFTLPDAGSLNYGKDQIGFFAVGKGVAINLDEANAGGGVSFDGQDIQYAAIHLSENASAPSGLEGVAELITGENTSGRIFTEQTFSGSEDVTWTPQRSGRYLIIAAAKANNTKAGISGPTSSLGDLSVKSNVTIVGLDFAPVRENDDSVSVSPDAGGTGADVSFAVDSSSTFSSGQVSHTVLIIEESKFDSQNEELVIENGTIGEIKTSWNDTAGVFDIADKGQIFSINPGQVEFKGSINIGSSLKGAIGGDSVTQTQNNTVNMSLTTIVGGPSATVNVGTLQQWPAQQYSYFYFATEQNGTKTVVEEGTVDLIEATALNLTANRTEVFGSGAVSFNVTREDSGNATNATLTVEGPSGTRTIETDDQGFAEVQFDTAGQFTVTASKEATATLDFINDTKTIDVLAPGNAQVKNFSVSPTAVKVDENVTVSVNVNNTGDTDADLAVNLTVNGTEIASAFVQNVGADEVRQVDFVTSFPTAGTKDVSVNGLPPKQVTVSRLLANLTISANQSTIVKGETVKFTVRRDDTGNRTSATVSVDGTSKPTGSDGAANFTFDTAGDFTVSATKPQSDRVRFTDALKNITVLEPGEAEVTNLSVTPGTVKVDENATVTANVTNVGVTNITAVVDLLVNGTEEQSLTFDLAPNETREVNFTVSFATAGPRAIGVNNAGPVPLNVTRLLSDLTLTADRTTVIAGQTVTFSVRRDDTGNLTDATVTVNGTSKTTGADGNVTFTMGTPGNFTAIATKVQTDRVRFNDTELNVTVLVPPQFEFDNASLVLDPPVGLTNAPVNVSVNVTNVGETTGTFTAFLRINDAAILDETGELTPNESATVRFTIPPGTLPAGTFLVNVTGGAFTVKDAGPKTLVIEQAAPDIELNTTSLGYGDVGATPAGTTRLIKAVNVTNNGTDDLRLSSLGIGGTDGDQFALVSGGGSGTLAPGESRIVEVAFRPTRRGDATGTLSIPSNDPDNSTVTVSLNGTGVAPELTLVTPGPLSAGALNLGSNTTVNITVENTGNDALSVSSSLSNIAGGAFSLTGTTSFTLAPGAQQDIQVKFNPASAGLKTASVALGNNDSFAGTATVRIAGTGKEARIRAAPASVDVGNVTIGADGDGRILVENTGTIPLEVAPQAPSVTGNSTASMSTANFTLAPGATRFVPITIDVQDVGAITGSVTFETDGVRNGDRVNATVSLAATGQQPNVAGLPASTDFGQVPVGSATTTSVSFSNDGNATLTVDTTQAFNASEQQHFELLAADTLSVAPGETRTLTVLFSPDAAANFSADLGLLMNDPDPGDDVQNVSLTGEGVTAKVSASPTSVDFGTLAIGTTENETVTVENVGSDTLNVTSVAVTGSAFANDSIAATQLTAGESTTVNVSFSPGSTHVGPQVGLLNVTVGTATGPQSITIPLGGEGSPADVRLDPLTVPVDAGFVKTSSSTTTTFTVENVGINGTVLDVTGASFSGADPAAFSVTTATPFSIDGGDSQVVTVQFNPGSPGAKSATLTLTTTDPDEGSVDVQLSGSAASPEASVSTGALNFGTVGTGFSAVRSVTLSNTGGVLLNVSDISLGDTTNYEFVTKPETTIAPGGSRTIRVRLAPTTSGNLDSTLSITTNATTDPTVTLTAAGSAPTVTVSNASGTLANTTTIEFGETPIGSSSAATITVENTGNATLILPEPTISGDDPGAFSLASGQGDLRIAPGTTERFTFAYSPTAEATNTSRVVFSGMNDPTTDTFVLEFSGTGTVANASLDPASVAFGEVDVGTTSTETVTLRNVGTASLTIQSVGIVGADAASFSLPGSPAGTTVSAGGSTTIDVAVTPPVIGGLSARVVVTTSSSTGTQQVAATMGSTGVKPIVEFEQIPVDFGEVRLGSSATRTVLVNNTGNLPLDVSDLSVTGADAGIFSVRPDSTTIDPGTSAPVTLTFAPQSLPGDEGTQTATLEVTSNDTDTPTVTRNLTAVGTTPRLEISPPAVQFGTVAVGTTVTTNVTISNDINGTANVNLTDIRILGAGAGFGSDAFSLDTDPTGTTLVPGQSVQVEVNFTPTSATPRLKFANLFIQTNDTRRPARVLSLSNSDLRPVPTYASVRWDFNNPISGTHPAVSMDEGIRGVNASMDDLTVTTSAQPAQNFFVRFETADDAFGTALTGAQLPIRYIDVTENVTASGDFANATIKFRVQKSVLNEFDISTGEVTLRRSPDGSNSYTELSTRKVGETRTEHIFVATTTGFSEFVVAGELDQLNLTLNRTGASTPLRPGDAVKATVTSDGSAVSGATISVDGTSAGTTDSSGVLVFTPSQLGSLTVTAAKTGFADDSATVTVKEDIQLAISAGSTSVDEGDSVTFTVTESGSGDAVQGATVSFAGNSGTTDSNGKVTLSADQTGNVSATASKTATATATYQDASVDVSVSAVTEPSPGPSPGPGPAPEPSATVSKTTTATSVEVTIEGAQANATVSISLSNTAVDEDDASAGLQSLDIGFNQDTDFSITVTSDRGDTPAFNAQQGDLAYFNIAHDASDDSIDEVTFSFRVTKAALEDRGIEPADVVLYRYTDGSWTPLETTMIRQTTTAYHFEAVSPGLSVFAVSSEERAPADIRVTDASLGQTQVEAGTTVQTTATLENSGDEQGTFTAELTVDGSAVASQDVTLDGGESTTIDFAHTFEDAGTFDVAVSGTAAGTIEVTEPATETETVITTAPPPTDTDTATEVTETTEVPPETTETPPESPPETQVTTAPGTATPTPGGLPGFVTPLVIVLVLVLLAAGGYLYLRREGQL